MIFTPFIGFQLILAMVLAFVMRANVVAALIGTIVGNPWTFPLIWTIIYWLGSVATGSGAGVVLTDVIDAQELFLSPVKALKPVLVPMIIGGVPLAVLVWWIVYWPAYQVVERYKAQRLKRLGLRDERRGG